MKQLFLKAKHWQIFIFAIGLPFLMVLVMILTVVSIIASQQLNSIQSENFTFLFFMVPIVAILGNFVQFYWIYTVSTELQKFQAQDTRSFKVKRFKFFFFIPVIYLIFLSSYIGYIVNTVNANLEPNFLFIALGGIFIFFMHMLTIFGIIYTMYFVAKTITSVEMKKESHFSDYIGDFFLIWFFPVGIWFIQPRINKIITGNYASEQTELLDV